MTNYNILQLNAKELSELKEIATKLALKVPNSITKDKLVYEILDQQAVVNAQEKSAVSEGNDENKRKRMRIIPKKAAEQKVFSTRKDEDETQKQPVTAAPEKAEKPATKKAEATKQEETKTENAPAAKKQTGIKTQQRSKKASAKKEEPATAKK